MYSILSCIVAAGLGLLVAHLLSRPEELRPLRLSQLILVPAAMVGAVCLLPRHAGRATLGDLQNFIQYLFIAAFVAVLLAPNIAYYVGIGFSNVIDPHDWTPLEEEIALRPIAKMIDKDRFQEALAKLDGLLEKHKPTYEALLLKSKLLHHFSSVDETVATLLEMIPLSHSTDQQLSVMEALATLENQLQNPAMPFIPGTRRIRTRHEFVLFPAETIDRSAHETIPPGEYEVEETLRGTQRWLKLAGRNLGNAQMCWEAVQETVSENSESSAVRFLRPIARMHQTISNAFTGRAYHQVQAQGRTLLKEANALIRREDWTHSVPLLQKASACDPHSYEIAYRLMQAVRHTEGQEGCRRMLRQVLDQSRWSEDEKAMLVRD